MSIMTFGRQHPVLLSLYGIGWSGCVSGVRNNGAILGGASDAVDLLLYRRWPRRPSRIPLKDALIYIGISLAIVIGVVLYVIYAETGLLTHLISVGFIR
jgi:hypothetical protein